jgi:hypothetical protein
LGMRKGGGKGLTHSAQPRARTRAALTLTPIPWRPRRTPYAAPAGMSQIAGQSQSPRGRRATTSTRPYLKAKDSAVRIRADSAGFRIFPPAPLVRSQP